MGFLSGTARNVPLSISVFSLIAIPSLLVSVSYFEIASWYIFFILQVLSFHRMTLPKNASCDIFRISSGRTHCKAMFQGTYAFMVPRNAAVLVCYIYACMPAQV